MTDAAPSHSQDRTDATAPRRSAVQQGRRSANGVQLAFILAWYDVRHRYARSVLGPFWITLQTAIFVAFVGFVFSAISRTSIDEFLPWFAVSFVIWTFAAGATNNSTTTLSGSSGFIKDRGLPAYIFFLQCYFRHVLFLLHNLAVVLVTFLVFGGTSLSGLIMAVPGLLVFGAVTLCATIVVGTLATRFRDVQPLVESLVHLAFLASPIMWKPGLVEGREFIIDFNPVAHLLAIWRDPLLFQTMSPLSWLVSLTVLALSAAAALFALKQLRRAAFWV